ncbi:MAG TPA: recombinase family protein [Pseudonocardiaceae bacterium]|nr:recombinase family protein [Pseudonocardiaceae bacterium]
MDTNAITSAQNQSTRSALEAARTRAASAAKSTRTPTASRDVPIAFCYLRVSTKEQARTGGGAEGYSIPAQRDACRAKAASLGAVIEEYVDAGESARSADRDDLQRMLRDIKTIRPDYVIVHKIDRLARNRADDVAINLLLKKHGVTLVSCIENIDDTPSGRLLYGLLAEIAQFYSGNLAQEVMKGLLRKAEEGGTPFRAPLGYRNRREMRDGIDYSWVELDPERAGIVKWCFEQYATGEWSGIDLTLAAGAKGLTNRPRGGVAGQPVGLTTMYHILQNPYYMGVVAYRGIHYEGKHPALIEPDTWLACQDILASHHHGEKDRVHPHYLRGTIYCSACGGRLVYSEQKGHGGTYVYFWCVKRKTKKNNCTRRAVRVERVEEAIVDFYGRFRLRAKYAAEIQQAVRDELASQQHDARRDLQRATKRRTQAEGERQKLLHAHYAGAVPQDLLASEMQRLTRELKEADLAITAAKTTNQHIEATLDAALTAAANCQAAYAQAPGHIRRQINQGFFEKLFIGEDGSVERAVFTEPFQALLDAGRTITDAEAATATATTDVTPAQTHGDGRDGHHASDDRARPDLVFQATYAADGVLTQSDHPDTTCDRVQMVAGVNQACLVELTGFEPVTPTLPGTLAFTCDSTLLTGQTRCKYCT